MRKNQFLAVLLLCTNYLSLPGNFEELSRNNLIPASIDSSNNLESEVQNNNIVNSESQTLFSKLLPLVKWKTSSQDVQDFSKGYEFNFIIDERTKISIVIPEASLKYNYYYEATEKLQMFDEVTISFIRANDKVLLGQDMIDYVISCFYKTLEKAIPHSLQLPDALEVGNVGAQLNKMLHGTSKLDVRSFWMWSSLEGMHTLLYNHDDKIYLEISPSCLDLFTDKPDEDIDRSFKEFMSTYKPHFVTEISLETAQDWLYQCKRIMKIINMPKW